MSLENVDPIGIYAAIIATLVLGWDIVKFHTSKRKIIIIGECLDKEQVAKHYSMKKEWVHPLRITITNKSDRNCNIKNIFIYFDKHQKEEKIRIDLPKEISPGGSHTFKLYEDYDTEEYHKIEYCRRIEIFTSDEKRWSSEKFPFLRGNLFTRWRYSKEITSSN